MSPDTIAVNDMPVGSGGMTWMKSRLKTWYGGEMKVSVDEIVEMSVEERWAIRVEEDWRDFPDYMAELKQYGCDFHLDDVTGCYHIPTEPNGSCGIRVYNTFPERGVWSIVGSNGVKWNYTDYDIKDIHNFRSRLRYYMSRCMHKSM